ncbi:DUF1304 domain-containing protein [Herbiconiux sp. L3-i23]|uniref:DUF1304 domain-containing protein n=1 Tax=Herbiconiux sp. L3-i23 TaxID=2905871 RepID=UPI00204F323B|nr:DUF1304 domain-containing protein [Herbiconiux sp. L3-i23]BDI22328.1 membrane protein [Herbiconiux sp. L3-i23]
MIVVALVLAGIAALIHVYIFVLESVTWTSARTRRTFGTTPDQAEATRALAFNQGFYNLFLAIVTAIGVVVVAAGSEAVGAALVFAGTLSMAAAGLVLAISDRSKLRAALVQATAPTIAAVLLAVGLYAFG